MRWLAASTAMVILGLVLAPFAPPGPSRPAAAQDVSGTLPPSVSVTAVPTSNVTDGQRVVITVHATAEYPIISVEARLCRSGVDYQSNAGRRPHVDFNIGGDNCPDLPVSSSGDVSIVDTNVTDQAQSPAGNVVGFRVGSGTVNWPTVDPKQTLTCDVDNPCSLVVELRGADGVWHPWVTPITYQIDDPVAGCGGPSDGVLATAGSDRLFDAWVAWTLGECGGADRAGAAGRAAFQGEGTALSSYNEGTFDLAYSGAGYDSRVGLLEAEGEPPPERPSVAVPLALNATVLAVGGGMLDPQGQKAPFQDIKLTLDEVAKLMAGGFEGIRGDLAAVEQRNPSLREFFDSTSAFGDQPGAYPEGESTSWFMTNHLAELRPDSFQVPNAPGRFGSDAGRPRGAETNLALADPSYLNAVSLVLGRPAARKIMSVAASPSSSGGVWFFTDLATAQALGLTVVQIENANGDFVAPTPESMAAAVPTMTVDEHGVRLPDPRATGEPGATVAPYPLTFVEYGIAPTEPLADAATNVCRPTSQDLLGTWLMYVTTGGQAVLPSGLEPLPPALAAEATAAIAEVGATPSATPCTAEPTPPTTTPTTLGEDVPTPVFEVPTSGSGSGFNGAGGGGAGPSGPMVATLAPEAAELALDAANAELTTASIDKPGFAGSQAASVLLAVLAMFGLAGATYVAISVTSGRRLRLPGLGRRG